jgi:hypothetical protein
VDSQADLDYLDTIYALSNEYKVNYKDEINEIISNSYNASTTNPGIYNEITDLWEDIASGSYIGIGESAVGLLKSFAGEVSALSKMYRKLLGQQTYYNTAGASDTQLGAYNAAFTKKAKDSAGSEMAWLVNYAIPANNYPHN